MKIESLSFTEAAEKLAQKAGVAIAPSGEALSPLEKERLKIKELLELAADYYHRLLLKSSAAVAARKYLESRRVSPESIEAFQLGFAPKGGTLVEAAQKKGYPKELLVKAGLAAPRKTGSGLRDFFYDRVLFPIRDARGAVAGFGGRLLGEGEPKYLNSPDSPVFSKAKVLYGQERRVLLMEGYMDVIAAHQYGFKTACAPLGTALTLEQAALIKRYATDVVIIFDADSPGLSAALRGAETLIPSGLNVLATSVPGGKDPDEHLHQFGAESFKKCVDDAKDLPVFKTEILVAREKGPLSVERKSAIARELIATICKFPDEVKRVEWGRWLAQRLKIDELALRKDWAKAEQSLPAARPRRDSAARLASASPQAELAEEDRAALILLLRSPASAGLAREEDFKSEAGRRIWSALAEMKPLAADWSAKLLESLPDELRRAVSPLIMLAGDLGEDDSELAFSGLLERRRAAARVKEIEPRVIAGEVGLMDEYQKLLKQLSNSRGIRR
jgi:DNA primase